jgi:hypothetical protein
MGLSLCKDVSNHNKMRILIFFTLLSTQILSQNLVYIPDQNLKTELINQGFTTNDSLDTRKIVGRLQLDLSNKKIQDLEGLQYFNRVWKLNLSNNNISNLRNLPPNLTVLYCANNKLIEIDGLPNSLQHLGCNGNEINRITNLPNSLTSINFSNNKMSEFPVFTDNLQFVNYYKNPIPLNKLPSLYQNVHCENSAQNCMPNELIKWKILNNTLKDSANPINKIKITLLSNYNLENGKRSETFIFKKRKSNLVSKRIYLNRTKGSSSSIKNSIKKSSFEAILSDIYTEKLVIYPIIDSSAIINLTNKKNGMECFSDCSHCSRYSLSYTIYTLSDTINLNYGFEGTMNNGISICSKYGPEDIKSILEWLYIYRLTNLTFKDHLLVNRFFNRKNLDKIVEWDKEYEQMQKPALNTDVNKE